MEALTKFESQISVVDSSITDKFEQFIKFLDVAPLTVRAYSSGLKMFARFLSDRNITTPTRDDVLSYKKELEALGRKPATIALYLSALRRFFAWSDNAGIYPNIATGVKAPKLSKGHKKDCFSAPQIKSVLSGIDRSDIEGLRNYAIMTLMTTGGLRTIEVTRANIKDLRVVSGVPVLYIQGKGRTEKADFVKLPTQVEAAIREYLKARGQVEIQAPLFSSISKRNKGARLSTRTISGIAKTAMRKAGFNSKRLTAHSLRHTAITLNLLAGNSLTDVQAFARHSSINTTMIYNHAVNRMTSTCENTIAEAIF